MVGEFHLVLAGLWSYSNAELYLVRLGKSGLKVSKIILGCMSYGNDSWGKWILGEKEGIEHIKAAYAAGINVCDFLDIPFVYLSKYCST